MSGEPRFIPIALDGAIPNGQMREYFVNGVEIVVANVDGEYHALSNRCPHQGGPLGKGRLDEAGVIWCPWHLWQFDAKTGRACWPEGYTRASHYPVKVEDGKILVGVG